eukprot:1412950-Amphidinium_carterae.1
MRSPPTCWHEVQRTRTTNHLKDGMYTTCENRWRTRKTEGLQPIIRTANHGCRILSQVAKIGR